MPDNHRKRRRPQYLSDASHYPQADRQQQYHIVQQRPEASPLYKFEPQHETLQATFEGLTEGLISSHGSTMSTDQAAASSYYSMPIHHSADAGPVETPEEREQWESRFWPMPGEPRPPLEPRENMRSRSKPVVTKGERSGKDFRVAADWLSYSTLEEASKILEDRTALQIVGPDDVDQVASRAGEYVLLLLKTYDLSEAKLPPGVENRNEDEISYFHQWQEESHNKVVERLLLELPRNGAFAEERVWAVVRAVIDMHRHGAPNIEVDKLTFKNNLSLKCSDRLKQIFTAMQGYTIIRLDVLSRAHIEQLVANPAALVGRKLTNVWVNQKKAAKNKKAKIMGIDQT